MGVHDVEHYPEIKRLLGIPEDEPIFILRAQDALALKTIADYSESAYNSECPREFIDDLSQVVIQFSMWRTDNPERLKVPD